MVGMKMQLDAAALERLLGGQTEIEVELRSAVVQAFAKQHLKAVASSDAFETFLATEAQATRHEFVRLVEQYVGQSGVGRYGCFQLNKETADAIEASSARS